MCWNRGRCRRRVIKLLVFALDDIAENKDHAGDFVSAIANGRRPARSSARFHLGRQAWRCWVIEQQRIGFIAISAALPARLRRQIDRNFKDGFQWVTLGFLGGQPVSASAAWLIMIILPWPSVVMTPSPMERSVTARFFLFRCNLTLKTFALGDIADHCHIKVD